MNNTKNNVHPNYNERLEAIRDINEADAALRREKEKAAYLCDYDRYLRKGFLENSLATKADSSGGYLVPDEMELEIVKIMAKKNILRRIAKVISTDSTRRVPVVAQKGGASWIEEEDFIPESDDVFESITIGAHKLGTRTLVSEELLHDSGFDIEAYLMDAFAERIATAEENAFLNGDGVSKPLGLMKKVQVGATTETAGVITMDDIFNLIYSVPMGYRKNGVLLMNDVTLRELSKIRTAYDRNIWSCDATRERGYQIFGIPIMISDAMPNPEEGSMPILYGDFSYFWIADRGNRCVRRLNELYADRGQVGFQVTQRVDAQLMQPEAIKGLLVATEAA